MVDHELSALEVLDLPVKLGTRRQVVDDDVVIVQDRELIYALDARLIFETLIKVFRVGNDLMPMMASASLLTASPNDRVVSSWIIFICRSPILSVWLQGLLSFFSTCRAPC